MYDPNIGREMSEAEYEAAQNERRRRAVKTGDSQVTALLRRIGRRVRSMLSRRDGEGDQPVEGGE